MVVEYANHLQSKGHSATILTSVFDSLFSVNAGIEISLRKSKLSTVLKALSMKRDVDIIVADIIVMTFFLSFRNRGKLLYFAQDYDESYYKNSAMRALIRAVYFYCLRILKIPVIAVSEELGKTLRGRFKADVTVVPNGVDTSAFYPDRDGNYLSLREGKSVILIFARSDYRKGFDIAANVLSRFKEEIENKLISVWAVGEDLGTPFPVRRFGFVPPETLRKILSCSDILLYPSRHEGLPLFVLEAMACGCIVMTTEAAKIVSDNLNGIICPIDDRDCFYGKLHDFIHNPPSRYALIKNAFETASRFSIDASRSHFERSLLRLLHG